MNPSFLLLAAVAFAQAPELSVLSVSPAGPSHQAAVPDAIVVTFNQPMVALASPSDMGRYCPLKLSPALAGRCRWRGTQILAFEPEKPLPLAASFRAEIPAGTRSAVSGRELKNSHTWQFETGRPELVDSRPRDGGHWIAPNAVMFLQFNQTMDPRRARGAIALRETKIDSPEPVDEISVGVRRATAEEIKSAWSWSWHNVPTTSTVLAVKPSRTLRADRSYTLALKDGLRSAVGELGMAHQIGVRFEGVQTFRLVSGPGRECLPRNYELSFSNPVSLAEVAANARIEGSTRTFDVPDGAGQYLGDARPDRRLVVHRLEDPTMSVDRDYVLVLSSGLRDAFGSALGVETRVPFSNDGFCPRLAPIEHFGILEQELPARLPIVAVNVTTVTLRKAIIADDAFIPFFRSSHWGCRERLAIDAPEKSWNLGLPRNQLLRTFIDLGPVFASSSPARSGGLAAVELRDHKGCLRKSILDVTRIGLHFKSSPDSSLVWATYFKSGRPAIGVPIELRNDEGKVLWRGKTSEQGLADAPGWKALGITDWDRWARPNLWAFARDPKGTAVLSLNWSGLEPWRFNISSDRRPQPRQYRAVMFTERGVYRSGETVHVKAILRKLERGDWRLLGASDPHSLLLTLNDSRGAEVAKATVTVSGLSSVDHSFDLSPTAPNGHWTVSLRELGKSADTVVTPVAEDDDATGGEVDGGKFIHASYEFRVEAFKPAAFEVKAVPAAASWMAGDTYEAGIEGWWLFGAPMAGANAAWSLRLEPSSYAPPGWPDFTFMPPWRRRQAEIGRLLASNETTLDAQGRAKATSVLDVQDATGPLMATFEASVTSPERQRLFGRASAVVHRADLYFGLKSDSNFVEKGQTWNVEAVAVRPDGRRVTTQGAHWSLLRREWLSIQRAGVAGRLEWVSEEHESFVSSGSFAASPSTWTFAWTSDRPGAYEFALVGQDEHGRPSESVRAFSVAGAGDAWWARKDDDIVEILADKESYKPGETARLLVKSPFDRATALVTVEREGIISRWTQEINGGASLVRVPINDRMIPNAFISVTLVHGRAAQPSFDDEGQDIGKPQAKFGYKAISVDPGSRRLKVEVSVDKGEYRPGGALSATVKISRGDGRPVPGEVTLFAVDEGVLNLTAYATPDPFDEFYGQRPLLVGSADSHVFVIGQRSYGEKGKNRGGGGDGRGSPLPGVDLRSNFSPTAYWGPTVAVGPDGVASASFKLPDSLTRFRLMAVAHDVRRFGSGETRAVVAKPLSMRPSLPRLARVGDEFEGGVVVHNFTKQDSTVTVALALDGTAIAVLGATSREVFVPAGRAVETTWKCRATGLGSAEFRFAAKAGTETDGLRWTVPVRATERMERAATSGVVDGTVIEEIGRPSNAAPGTGTLETSFSPTALAGLREGVRYLLEYPYGCLEQRLSRMMPVVVSGEMVAEFGLGTLDALKSAVQKGFERLPDFQHPTGGYGYWPTPWQPDPWLTAYALETAELARREGYAVPEHSLRKAAAWLKAYLGNTKLDWAYPYSASEDYASRAYAVYVLGLRGDPQPAYFRKLYERRDQLPTLGKAYLLKAAKAAAGEPESKALADDLMNQARFEARTVHFEDVQGESSYWIHDSNARTTAVALQAFLEARGGFPGDEKAVRWLVDERKAKGRWRTTIENSASLRALQDFYRRYEKDVPAFTATMKKVGQSTDLRRERFDGRTLTTRREAIALNDVFAGAASAKIEIAKQGLGRLYYDLVIAYAPASFDRPSSEGFEVKRRVAPLHGDLRAGKRAVVTVTVSTKKDRTFVALEDPLPAGWEIVDPSFAVEGEEDARADSSQGGYGADWGTFQRAERYDDRIQVFADFMAKGEHTWSYLIQATTPGKFHVPATAVEAMYQPEVFGRSASGTAEVLR